MLDKELEILKLIEELYSGDVSEQDFLEACKGKETKIAAWRDAFAEYPLFEVTKAINHYYVKKSSKTRPNIAQLTAILCETNASKENPVVHHEIPQPTFGVKFAHQDAETGDMNWLVPEYQEVEYLIRRDYFPFVQNIYNPSYDEFRACMERHSIDIRGTEHHFPSANDINRMTAEQRAEFEQAARNFDLSSIIKRIN